MTKKNISEKKHNGQQILIKIKLQTRKSTNGTVGSEEDTSLSGSPYFSRKRFGSFNNSQNDSAKDDKFSPGTIILKI